MAKMTQDELFEKITNRIVEAIESGNNGEWEKPWTQVISLQGVPRNVDTGKNYKGANVMVGLFEQAINDFSTAIWGTYNQWKKKDAQVRKGETGTLMIKWGISYYCDEDNYKGKRHCPNPNHANRKVFYANPFYVFNADQVDGYEIPEIDNDLGDEPERLERVEQFVQATGADIRFVEQNQAYHHRLTGQITLPLREQFDTPQALYATMLHELIHWTGGPDQLDRRKGIKFGDNVYAAEELVAELGSAFLQAHLGVAVEPSESNVQYLEHWVTTMRADSRALYRAAKASQAAVDYLQDLVYHSELEAA